jgi:hypothetical protein
MKEFLTTLVIGNGIMFGLIAVVVIVSRLQSKYPAFMGISIITVMFLTLGYAVGLLVRWKI